MFIVYLIKSRVRQWYYVGLTADVQKRLADHSKGAAKSTKAYKPFDLIYTKRFQTRTEARDYEKFLKIRSNKEKLISRLQR